MSDFSYFAPFSKILYFLDVVVKLIGVETVQYVSNIYKYSLAYRLVEAQRSDRQ